MRGQIVVFLQGVCAAGAWAIGLIFLRYRREADDRLFAFFGYAFWLLALSWALLAVGTTDEYQPYVYGLRLAAFVLIIIAVVDKNRATRAGGVRRG
jgi:hypothetical protein